jgi:predicted phosphoribosyltransferase
MMSALFTDRRDAGRQLAARLQRFRARSDVIVLGLPRGGVPVAAEIADDLDLPLDVFVVRKLGVPGQEELAMGAVASGGVRVVNEEIVRLARVRPEAFEAVTARELREIGRREAAYRAGRDFPALAGATVILVDDGVATGSTMLAGVHALRKLGPAAVIVAAPVMAHSARRALERAADGCEYVALPEPFYGVGMHYADFSQTPDEEVREILRRFPTRSFEAEAAHAGHH